MEGVPRAMGIAVSFEMTMILLEVCADVSAGTDRGREDRTMKMMMNKVQAGAALASRPLVRDPLRSLLFMFLFLDKY
jgi:hypothetical protein